MKKFKWLVILATIFIVSCNTSGDEPNLQTTKTVIKTETPTYTETSTHTPTYTSTPSPTASEIPSLTPTKTPSNTPKPTSTPFGGSNYLYKNREGSLVLQGEGNIYTQEDFEKLVEKDYDWVHFYLSQDLKVLQISGVTQTANGWKRDRYVSTFDLQNIQYLGSDSIVFWSQECQKLLVSVEGNDFKEEIHIQNIDGSERVKLPEKDPYDGHPFWSHDCSFLYWIHYGSLRTIDPITGKSKAYTNEFLEDFTKEFGRLYIYASVYSPSRDKLAFMFGNKVFIANTEFAKIEIIIQLGGEDPRNWPSINNIFWSPDGKYLIMLSKLQAGCDPDCKDNWSLLIYGVENQELKEYDLEALGVEQSLGYRSLCGYTPDGKNIMIGMPYDIHFFNVSDEEIVKKIEGSGGACPVWISVGSLEYQNLLSKVKP